MVFNILACSLVSHCIGVLSGSLFDNHWFKIQVFSWPMSLHLEQPWSWKWSCPQFIPAGSTVSSQDTSVFVIPDDHHGCHIHHNHHNQWLSITTINYFHQFLLHCRWQRPLARATQSCWTRPCFRNQTLTWWHWYYILSWCILLWYYNIVIIIMFPEPNLCICGHWCISL